MPNTSYKHLNSLLIDSLSGSSSNTNDLHSALIHYRNDLISLKVFDQHLATIKNHEDARIKLLSKMLNISDTQSSCILNSKEGDLEFYFSAREHLMDTLEIIVRYSDFANTNDPFQIINRICDDVVVHSNMVSNLIQQMVEYSSRISSLEPLQNESTTTLRQEYCKLGALDAEIDSLLKYLKREINGAGLILCRIASKFGLK